MSFSLFLRWLVLIESAISQANVEHHSTIRCHEDLNDQHDTIMEASDVSNCVPEVVALPFRHNHVS